MIDNQESSFYKELLNDFKSESAEHYETIVQGLFKLISGEKAQANKVIETIYRSTHSLKGAARAVNLTHVERVCSSLESVFGKIKNSELELTSALLKELQDFTDLLGEALQNTNNPGGSIFISKITRAVKNLEYVMQLPGSSSVLENIESLAETSVNKRDNSPPLEEVPKPNIDSASVRISTKHLNTILTQTESFVTIKNKFEHYRKELEDIYHSHREPQIYNLLKDLTEFNSTVIRMTEDLTANIRNTLLSSFDTLLRLLPRMVRDISKEYSKEINFKAEGAFVEIDRRILEELKDPLIHLLRNSIDHGIELPQERVKSGKSREGTILIKVEKLPEKRVNITIEDDGAGIDKSQIVESALKRGVITLEKSRSINDQEIYDLIFQSGVSSAKFVTDISGRGLGMSIVADKIANLGGTIDIETKQNLGTKFIISIPQTITTFRGVLVKCGNQDLIIPSQYVKSIKQANNSEVSTIGNKSTIKDSSGETVGLVKLSSVIGIAEQKRTFYAKDLFYLVYLIHKNSTIAYIVDSVTQEYEGILKNMGPQLSYAKNFIGVTIIKNEVIVPVINVKEVMANTILDGEHSYLKENLASPLAQQSIFKVLVVEDSITIRSMLRNMIENDGYNVTTAVDGQDALDKLATDYFDIVVTDIEMPNLNGFELTHRIKTNSSLKELPVILVTALESPLDMKKGMDSGADAYIVKSNFEKSNLLETIKRLL